MTTYRITIPFQNIYFDFDRQGAFDYLRALNFTEANANTILQKVDTEIYFNLDDYVSVEKLSD